MAKIRQGTKKNKWRSCMASSSGFSLVDVAIMLAVAGLASVMLISGAATKKENKQVDVTTDHTAEIITAINTYVYENGHLPCPASGTISPASATYGKETDCSAAAVSGVSDPAVPTGYAATDAIRIGVLPVRALGLPDEYMIDGWGNRLTYVVIKKLATNATDYTAFTTAVTTGVIQVVDSAGTQTTGASTTAINAYGLISHGQDGKGSYTRKGVSNVTCGTLEKDTENCDNDYVFRAMNINSTEAGANFFYDMTSFKTAPSVATDPTASVALSAVANGISSYGWTSCALKKADSTMWCWGADAASDIPDAALTSYRFTPTAESTSKAWKRIGQTSNCAIANDDTLWCWGDNVYGEVGDGTTTTRNVATAVSGGGAWADVSGTCGLKTNGSLWCWGRNNYGQVGDGTSTTRTVPTAISAGNSWKQVSGDNGRGSYCAIKSDDTLWCWGNNANGQLGLGSTTSQNVPTKVGTATWQKISVYHDNACGIQMDGTLWCWGNRSKNQVGNGDVAANATTPVQVDTGSWVTVSVGLQNSCAIKTDNTMRCFGVGAENVQNTYSMYSNGASTQINGFVTAVYGSYATFTEVAVGDASVCAIEKTTGTAVCWGDNLYGEMANPSATLGSHVACAITSTATWGPAAPSNTTSLTGCKPIYPVVSMDAVTSGMGYSCGVTTLGVGYCWGNNDDANLGDGTTVDKLSPTVMAGTNVWKAIEAGNTTSCGIKAADDTAWCWGSGWLGNGSGSVTDVATPQAVAGGYTWKKLDSSQTVSCGIRTDKTLWCWGAADGAGVFASGTTSTSPTQVPGGGNWIDISNGSWALKEDGTVWYWGNWMWAVNGSFVNSATPTKFSDGPYVKIAAQKWSGNEWHACALEPDGDAFCWGWSSNGALGNNDVTSRTWYGTPQAVQGGYKFTDIAVSQDSTCGVRTDGVVMCWGAGTNTGLGSNVTQRGVPTAVSGSDTFVSVDGGQQHICAVLTDKTSKCWGPSTYGEVGDGTLSTARTTPTTVSGCKMYGYDAAATTDTASSCGGVVPMKPMSLGNAFTCGATTLGSGYCWGLNNTGQLAISGDTSNKLVPTHMTGTDVWSAISAYNTNICGIKAADKSVWCWGTGALGDGNGWQAWTAIPKKVAGTGTWDKVVTGIESACGIKTDKTLWCWGANYSGLGNGSASGYSTSPVQVTGGGSWIDVVPGGCGIKADKTLWCWGNIGTNVPTVFDSGSWERLSSAMYDSGWHMCGIKTGGAMYCWGNGRYGALGEGNTSYHTSATPVAVLGGHTFIDVAVMQNASCGLTDTGVAKCWGGGFAYELGNGLTSQGSPVNVSGSDTFVGIAAGWRHACAVKADKTLKCWGASGNGAGAYYGAIGDGAAVDRDTPVTVSGCLTFGYDPAATSEIASGCASTPITNSMSAGGLTTCAIKNADNTIWCWGYDAYGQIGDGTLSTYRYIPYQAGTKTWKKVSVGGKVVCGLASDNTAWCWGKNTYGEVGDNSTTQRNAPVAVNGGATWIDVSAGGYNSCGIKTDGSAWCWGNGASGALGNGGTANSPIPVAVSGGYTWKRIAVGENGDANCAIKSDDTLWCWGYNNSAGGHGTYGALGVGTTGNKLVPTQVGTATWKYVSTNGYTNGCGIQSDNTLWCWGAKYLNYNGDGGNSGTALSPVQISSESWKLVSVGYTHSCGVKSDDTIRCWGGAQMGLSPYYSGYGNGSTTQLYTLVQPTTGSTYNTFTEVAASDHHACAIEKTTGTMFCWGHNGYGQLAQPSSVAGKDTPCAISSTATWGASAPSATTNLSGCGTSIGNAAVVNTAMKSLTSGGAYSCGVTASGQGYCWGYNADGALGDGTTANKSVPTAVTGGAVWKAISSGDGLTCGIKSADSTAWCWGIGVIGDGSAYRSTALVTPTAVAGGATWKKISAAGGSACGIKTDNTLWCWGSHYNGLMGNGSTSGYNVVPAQVSGGGSWNDISLGTGDYACAIKSDKTLYCWGVTTSVPTLLDSGSWESVDVGDWSSDVHACGIKTGGAAFCWRNGNGGRVGNGVATNTEYATPQAVSGGHSFIDISSAQNVSCGIRTDGRVLCWGVDAFGETGVGSVGTRSVPTLVSGTDTYTSIEAGWRHVCAIKNDKTAKCWGYNASGAVGDSTTTDRFVPTAVSGSLTFGP